MLKEDDSFSGLDFESLMDPSAFVGRSSAQVDEFVDRHVNVLRERYASELVDEELRV